MFEVRNRERVITFEGVRIAHVSAELPSKDRWSEFTIWLTTHGEWVLQGVGRTRVAGEEDRYWAVISRDPADVLDSIVDDRRVSRLARRLIAESLLTLGSGLTSIDA